MPRWMWLSVAWAGVGLGTAGAFLPVLPTTPFLLIALWSGSRADPRLRFRLYRHPRYGANLRAWQRHGVIPARAKALAGALMLLSAAILWWSAAPAIVLITVFTLFAAVAAFILTRPSRIEPARKPAPWQPAP